jgi:hypothetical protein
MKIPSCTYELKITLEEILPPIRRRLQVPSALRLCCLHDVFQTVIGWTDSHLHQFVKDGKYWSVPEYFEDADDIDILDERQAKIGELLKKEGDSVLYIYDMGDDWRHQVVLEKILPALDTTVRPLCLSGERHCPPEDVGGTSGYQEFLEVIFDPRHEEYEHSVRWAGRRSALINAVERFQPEEFDVKAVNVTLARMRWPARHRR